jgi:hypothetical protein
MVDKTLGRLERRSKSMARTANRDGAPAGFFKPEASGGERELAKIEGWILAEPGWTRVLGPERML